MGAGAARQEGGELAGSGDGAVLSLAVQCTSAGRQAAILDFTALHLHGTMLAGKLQYLTHGCRLGGPVCDYLALPRQVIWTSNACQPSHDWHFIWARWLCKPASCTSACVLMCVRVCSVRRLQVTKAVFVEPSTGRLVSPAGPQCPYTGVELVWNANNVWICMQVRGASRAHWHSLLAMQASSLDWHTKLPFHILWCAVTPIGMWRSCISVFWNMIEGGSGPR